MCHIDKENLFCVVFNRKSLLSTTFWYTKEGNTRCVQEALLQNSHLLFENDDNESSDENLTLIEEIMSHKNDKFVEKIIDFILSQKYLDQAPLLYVKITKK